MATKVIVWRVEKEGTGNGPWTSRDIMSAYCSGDRIGFNPSDHPGPWKDFSKEDCVALTKDHLFAARSLPELVEWFPCPQGRAAMADKGAILVPYIVDEESLLSGSKQCAFPKFKAHRLTPSSLKDLRVAA